MNQIKSTNMEVAQGVHRYNMPQSVNLYNNIWKNEDDCQTKGAASWGQQRIGKLFSLFGGSVNFSKKNVIDACSGLGRLAIASLELNAQTVYAVDGSFEGLLATSKREKRMRDHDLLLPNGKLVPIQCDMDNISEIFHKNSIDVIIHYMALHHMNDYKKTLKDFYELLKPDGSLAFNFFVPGECDESIACLREVFLKEGLDFTTEFLEKIGNIKGRESKKVCSLEDLISSKKKIDKKFDKVISQLKNLAQRFGIKTLANKGNLHWESMQTPHLNGLDIQEVRNYIKNSLNMEIKYSNKGIIHAIK
jgi:ubiquinone/menaquinone biosynthesis C-methylase UbiE